MNRRMVFMFLADVAKTQGLKLAAKHGRPLGEKLAARLSRAGVERGMLEQPLDLDALLARLKALRASGSISKEELRELTRQVKEQFFQRFTKR